MNASRIKTVKRFSLALVTVLYISTGSHSMAAHNNVHFSDIAADAASGVDYRSRPYPNNEILNAFKKEPIVDFVSPLGRASAPSKPMGAPGVAILDFDNDGDLDLYVTNAIGTSNGLFSSQWKETGVLTFVDVARDAGVSAIDQGSTGVCFGDIDNDGDHDLYVLGNFNTGNRLFENQGDGKFIDISTSSNTRVGEKHPTSCAMGDVNGDGLLDIAVGNSYDNWNHRLPLVTFNNDHLMEGNQLFLNQGTNVFTDISEEAGIDVPRRVTWAISLVDYDLDGDLDLISADDQGAKAPAVHGGVDHGYIRIYQNDGKGKFTDLTETGVGTNRVGAWMGLSFGDLNQDGLMDIFSTNVGFYITAFLSPILDFPVAIGDWQSGWFLSQKGGTFHFPGVGSMLDNPFGWGSSINDYDNDGDSDIIYHGGINMGGFADASNAGAILQNDGNANFLRDAQALAASTNHSRRNVQGMAVGDLNNDGFMDIISVSSEDWPEPLPLVPYVPDELKIGTPFDHDIFIWPIFTPINPMDLSQGFVWSGLDSVDGSLSVEINSADNGNNWVKVGVQGAKGLTDKGVVNRDGIGAVVSFTPKGGKPVMWPVVAGSSYASQESLEWVFGLGQEKKGTLEVLWPGGVRNKLYNVRAGENVLLPEIPCSYDNKSMKRREYIDCVETSLSELKEAGVLTEKQARRFMASAMKAYAREHVSHEDRDGDTKEEGSK